MPAFPRSPDEYPTVRTASGVSDGPAASGLAARSRLPLIAQGDWTPSPHRPDLVGILDKEAQPRIAELVPIRYTRMAASLSAFYRGMPAIMAADLAGTPDTGLTVQLSGDAHLSNFGLFASPERRLVFDLDDFDETLPGPFEWDIKRLATSLVVAAYDNDVPAQTAGTIAAEAARSYRAHIRELSASSELAVWYEHITADDLLQEVSNSLQRARLHRTLDRARQTDSSKAIAKLTEPGPDGAPRFLHAPPLIEPVDDQERAAVEQVFQEYRASLPSAQAQLLDRFRILDAARKVVGIGSVGTRCYVLLLQGRAAGDLLLLQAKEAEPSVLAPFVNAPVTHEGQRVVEGQRLLQAVGDIFLGWSSGPTGRHFYWRQLLDMKGSASIQDMSGSLMHQYAGLCGRALARGHARSGDRVAIAAYLGHDTSFDRAITAFALAYAEQTRTDYAAFTLAISDGRLPIAPS
ncbi:DUF2252 domain-containing protein [Streptomyces yerevanensis]|uniref:DUF2252 domain-containing protein n=1 Tax=Streptomyces yerevanensis TaxID=66378 RepID=UPI000997F700|nr:DUF2252 domain-containing protein [Streptomyces yerevanensis]